MCAVISDIHGNLEALRAVVARGEELGVDEWICLGDIVGYGANPNECLELTRNLCRVILLGNHDEAAMGGGDLSYFNPWAAEAILWTRRALDPSWKMFLRALPLHHETEFATFVHSTPIMPERWDYILDAEDALANADGFYTPFCFVGHSHRPGIYELPPLHGSDQPRWMVNVGSVGQPRDGDPRACMVLIRDEDAGREGIELVRVEYDIETARRKILLAGLPEILAERLRVGL